MNKKYSVDEALTAMMTIKNVIIIIVTTMGFAVLGLLLRGQGTTTTSYNAVSRLQVTQYDVNDKVMTFNSSDPVFLNTYLENLKNTQTQKAVKKELAKQNIKLSVDQIDSMVNLESVPQTTILKLRISGDTKKQVIAVNRAYDKVALKEYQKNMKTGSVKVVDVNQFKSTTTKRMSTKKVIFFASVLGLFVSAGLIFIRKYFNQKIISRHFIEDRTATAVIADAHKIDVQAMATDLVTRVQNDYQVIGVVMTDSQQNDVLNQIMDQLKEWQFNVKIVNAESAFTTASVIVPTTEDELIFVVSHLQEPKERLVLAKVDAIFIMVQEKITTKDQLLSSIKFAKKTDVPFIGSLYLK